MKLSASTRIGMHFPATGTNRVVNGESTSSKTPDLKGRVSIRGVISGLERNVLPVPFFEIWAGSVVCPKDLKRGSAHLKTFGYFNFKKIAVNYN
ncbi:MAG: hypothetical protein Ct9H300mP28_06300 [Pseudomonadota bacterium]|nr:MAG: hypothetical protein Ct9H300mP28_06300 [Pseudomonadota bacterium]